MKKFRKAPLLWLILASFSILTLASVFEYTTESQDEKLNIIKEPLLTIAFQNIEKGVLPFHLEQLFFPQDVVNANAGSQEEQLADGDGTQTVNGGENDQKSPSVSENEAPRQYEYQLVGKEYFDDAVFIGDSRTDGLARYSGLDNATFYAKNSLTIFDFFDKRFIQVEGKTYLRGGHAVKTVWKNLYYVWHQ